MTKSDFVNPEKGLFSSDFNRTIKRKVSDMFTCSVCIIHEFRCVLGPFVNLETKGGGIPFHEHHGYDCSRKNQDNYKLSDER